LVKVFNSLFCFFLFKTKSLTKNSKHKTLKTTLTFMLHQYNFLKQKQKVQSKKH
jgi:hypothetical protein